MEQPTLKDIFYSLQKQMKEKLSTSRAILPHAPTKGDAIELNWINWLKEYLPKRYQVDKAFIIDSNNRLSDQLDLVIYDQQYSPFVFKQDGAIYIPAESVYAVFEVKPELNKSTFEYASDKIRSARLLTRTSAPIVQADGANFKPKPPFKILGGVLTMETSWVDVFGEPFQNCYRSFDENGQIDLGCVLLKGGFKINYIDNSFQTSSDDESLIYFFLKLLIELQKLGTVPAMDIEAYARAIESI